MASAVIDTRGMSSTSHSGYVSFSGPSSSSSSRSSSYSGVTYNTPIGPGLPGMPGGSYNMRSANYVNATDVMRDRDIYSRVANLNGINNGLSAMSFNNDSFIKDLIGMNKQENAQNINQARENALMQYQFNLGLMKEQNKMNMNNARIAMQFEARQAQLNREFQERLSNTSHQREIEDLKRAGLNPILSANNGASTPSGAMADGKVASTGLGSVNAPQFSPINNATIVSSLLDTAMSYAYEGTLEQMRHNHNMSQRQIQLTFDKELEKAKYQLELEYDLKRGFMDGSMKALGTLIGQILKQ